MDIKLLDERTKSSLVVEDFEENDVVVFRYQSYALVGTINSIDESRITISTVDGHYETHELNVRLLFR